jgi:hypothetical protein
MRGFMSLGGSRDELYKTLEIAKEVVNICESISKEQDPVCR